MDNSRQLLADLETEISGTSIDFLVEAEYDFTVGKGLDTTTRASAHLLIGTDGTVYLSFDDYLGRNDLWAEYLDFLDSRWENRLEEEEK
jgi:hypothetical protein